MRILVYPHDLNMGGSQINAIELAAAVTRLGHPCAVFGQRGSLCSRIKDLGLEFIESPDPGRRPSLSVARTLRALVAERGFDVIHGYEWPPGLEAAMATDSLRDAASVTTVMSMAVAPFLPRWMPLVVGTQQISAHEQAAGRLNVVLIEPPVDLDHNQAPDAAEIAGFRQQWGLVGDLPTVVSVSRLVPELKAEGIFTAINVAGRLAASDPFQLLLVGDGRARPEMEELADRVNAAAGRRLVVFTGELSDPRTAYAAADVVLGMGGSALRALAFGKPLVVQGERGYFKTLEPSSYEEFRWQGWYGVGAGAGTGEATLTRCLRALVPDPARREKLGAYSASVVHEFSLESAARQQLTIYRDALANRAEQKGRLLDTAHSLAGFGTYYLRRRIARLRGTRKADDFNAQPVARNKSFEDTSSAGSASTVGREERPVLWFAGVSWDTLAGTDRQIATALAEHQPVVWVDTPQSLLRTRNSNLPRVSRPLPGVVRLRPPAFVGVQRPLLREVANLGRVWVARSYLKRQQLTPRAVIAATTSPMLDLTRHLPGRKIYYATDDFVAAAGLWGVSKRYLAKARERNLAAADLVLGVTEDLARHLQRRYGTARWLPNGADLRRFDEIERVTAADLPLPSPIVGVIGQFNSRTDLSFLRAVANAGLSLLLVGPRWYLEQGEIQEFDALVRLSNVHWTGEIGRDELPAHLRALEVGLTPYADSLFNRRSYPLKTLEYLAAGLPVVATDIAPLDGLDERFVMAAATPEDFARSVRDAVGDRPDAASIRASVAHDGWGDRAAQLLTWL